LDTVSCVTTLGKTGILGALSVNMSFNYNALENTTLVTKNYEDALNPILQEMSDEYQIYTNNNYERSSLSDNHNFLLQG